MPRDADTGKFRTQNFLDAKDAAKELQDTIKNMGPLLASATGAFGDQAKLIATIRQEAEKKGKISDKELKNLQKIAGLQGEQAEAISELAPGFASMSVNAGRTASAVDTLLGGMGGVVVAVGAAVKAFLSIAQAVTDTRKELGVSAEQAASITVQNKVLAQVAKGFGLTVEDISQAQASIRQDLGASVQESINLSLNFARTAAATGLTASQLTKTLSIMESVSSQSRDALLNQLRTNAALAGSAGVAPALVMQDLADNAQFFAKFAKDGGMNILNASIAARKLGLELGAVESISESLLNFESSIENQLQASLLLGRQINLDKARQLAITGDQEGVMREILKQVGGEAEFNRLNVIQRQALADSVGVNVEQLSRLVRNNTAAAGTGGTDKSVGLLQRIADNSDSLPSMNRKI
jgi:hypothetical protein